MRESEKMKKMNIICDFGLNFPQLKKKINVKLFKRENGKKLCVDKTNVLGLL